MNRRLKPRMLALLVAVAATAATVVAQKNPEDAIGFNPEKLYQFDNLDSVSVLNGNLTLTVPLVRYPVSSSLSYGFGLIYNVKAIDWEVWYDDSVEPPVYEWDPYPSLGANAGHGWRVTLGRLYPPGAVTVNKRSSFNREEWIYEGPAGDEHVFDTPAENSSPVLLTRDQTALRLVRIDNQPYPTREVEFPSGEIHRFQQLNTDWRLTEIRDRCGTRVTVTFEYDPADTKRTKKWFINEYIGETKHRSQTLTFTYKSTMEYASASRGMQLSSIEVTAPGNTTTTYTPVYQDTPISFPAGSLTVPLLKTFTLPDPDGTGPQVSQTYEFLYYADGTMSKVTYPTGGTTSYTYQFFQLSNTDDVCFNSPWGAVGAYATPAVKTRTISDGTTNREWKYVQRRGPQVALHDFNRCGNGFYGPFYWSRTSVLSPIDANNKRTRADYYFDIFGGLNPHERAEVPLTDNPAAFSELSTAGMPPADTAKDSVEPVPEGTPSYPADISATDGTRFLTSQSYSGCDAAGNCTNGTLHRSEYVEVAAPSDLYSNRGYKSTRTVYEDDAGCGANGSVKCESILTRSGDDGFALYTTETLSDNFGSALADRRVATTAYKVWTAADRLDSAKKWIREIYSEKSVTEGGATARTLFDFDTSTGRPIAQRSLAGAALAADDTLTLFGDEAASSSNNFEERSIERFFGGHNGGLGTSTATPFALPTVSSTPKYILRHTHKSGVRRLTEYLTPEASCELGTEGTCVTILTPLHRSIDTSTGLVTGSFDVSGVGTSYTYDRAFRFDTVTLPTGVTKKYTFTNTRATETTKNAAGTTLRTAIYDYDGLGRVKRSSATLANGKVGVVESEYDEMGRKRRISQPVESDSHPNTSVGTDWTTTTYDAFGRATSIKPPDNVDGDATTETRIAYSGTRKVERTVRVATFLTGTTAATTTETYDGTGRMVKVEENTGDTSSTNTSGTKVTTAYTYDVGGRVASVKMQKDGETASQDRTFNYDFRGFPTREIHPESGTTTYSEHDPRGHAVKRASGGRAVRFTFDKAERVTNVDEEIAGTPPTYNALKAFTFYPTISTPQSRAHKLWTATRHNHLPGGGTIDVIETYEYDLQGRVNKRATDVKRGAATIQTFSYGTNLDDFGLPKDLTMPTCNVTGCGNALGTVTSERTAGFLTKIKNGGSDIASLSYWPSGMVHQVTHSSSPAATDTYNVVKGLPRPSTIQFSGGQECPDIPSSPINAPDAVCAGSTGNTASVTPRSGITHEWHISAGSTITTLTTGDSITFTTAQSGVVTLTVTARDACAAAVSTKSVALGAPPSPPTITAPASICGGTTGNTASVPTTGATHTWTISGGTITLPATGDSITFTAGASGIVTLTATASRCGVNAPSSREVSITSLPTATVTGTTIVRGQPAALRLDLTGTPPWIVKWRDMASPVTVTASPAWREIAPSPSTTTTYWVDTVSASGCSATVDVSGTVRVLPPPPDSVVATTRENLIVDVSWSPVTGATAYQIERTTIVGGAASWATTVSAPSTTFTDTVPGSSAPIAYIYYVRAIDGEVSERGRFDFATAATQLYGQPNIVAGATIIRASDVAELRRGIDAFRAAFGVGAAFGSPPPSGVIRASDFVAMVAALNVGRAVTGYLPPFQYSVQPTGGGTVLRAHVTELREMLR